MRVAVASHDGHGVAPTAREAQFLLVFPVADDRVGEPEVRSLGLEHKPWVESTLAHGSTQQDLENDIRIQLVAFPPAETRAETHESDDLPAGLLERILDCEVLVARTLSTRQREECIRLGLLPLEVAAPGNGAEVVRFVVSGTPPTTGAGCYGCMTPSASKQ